MDDAFLASWSASPCWRSSARSLRSRPAAAPTTRSARHRPTAASPTIGEPTDRRSWLARTRRERAVSARPRSASTSPRPRANARRAAARRGAARRRGRAEAAPRTIRRPADRFDLESWRPPRDVLRDRDPDRGRRLRPPGAQLADDIDDGDWILVGDEVPLDGAQSDAWRSAPSRSERRRDRRGRGRARTGRALPRRLWAPARPPGAALPASPRPAGRARRRSARR